MTGSDISKTLKMIYEAVFSPSPNDEMKYRNLLRFCQAWFFITRYDVMDGGKQHDKLFLYYHPIQILCYSPILFLKENLFDGVSFTDAQN